MSNQRTRTKYAGVYKTRRGYEATWRNPSGQQRSRAFIRLEDARNHRNRMLADRSRNTYREPKPVKLTLSEAIDEFLAAKTYLEESTLALYQLRAKQVRDTDLASAPFQSLTRGQAQAYLNELLDRGMGETSVRQIRGFLHSVYAWAMDEDPPLIAENPVRKTKTPKPIKRARRALEEYEVDALAESIAGRYKALILTMAWTGVRDGEAAGLRVGDLVLDRNPSLTIQGALKEVGGRLIEGSTKNDEPRSFPIPAWLADELRSHLARYGEPDRPDALVFTSPRGGPLRMNNWRKRHFHPACRAAGINPPPQPHDLRHTAASLMAQAGFSPIEAQAVLGHGSVSMTLFYTQKYQGALIEKARSLGANRERRGLILRLAEAE